MRSWILIPLLVILCLDISSCTAKPVHAYFPKPRLPHHRVLDAPVGKNFFYTGGRGLSAPVGAK